MDEWDAFGLNRTSEGTTHSKTTIIDLTKPDLDDKSADESDMSLLNVSKITSELRADSRPFRPSIDSVSSPDLVDGQRDSGPLECSLFGSSLFGSVLKRDR